MVVYHQAAFAQVVLAVLLSAVIGPAVAVSPAAAASAGDVSLSNDYLSVSFSPSDFSLTSILSLQHSPPYEFLASPCTRWWSATVVSNTSHYTLTSASPHRSLNATSSPSTLLLFYDGLTLPSSLGSLDLQIRLTLSRSQRFVSVHYELRGVASSQPLSLWDWTWSICQLRPTPSNGTDYDDVVVINNSYGALYRHPLVTAPSRISEIYPSGGGAYQFLAYYHETSTSFPPAYPGLYFATHDPSAARKVFSYTPSNASVALSVTVAPPDPATPQPQPGVAYPFVLGVFSGDWWDAAQMYRTSFALQAPWTERSIRQRADEPRWFTAQTQLWLNTGWQYHDVFNDTQGVPAVVVERVANMQKRFGLPKGTISLHWYVFQQSNKFDAFYPVYFPAKANFTEAVDYLQSTVGVNVFPYINGRIMDIDLDKWRLDNASLYAAKSQLPQLAVNLSLYYEDYGNDVQQAAMCPATAYWQGTYADVADTLVNTHHVHGIYVDQVGAAAAQPCFDPSHGHVLGDGTAWVSGYRDFFTQMRGRTGDDVALVTESNAEPYMGMLNGYLTLTALQHAVVGDAGLLVPVFPAVYGGFMIGFGAIFTVADLRDNADGGFATTLAAQLVYGVQLGWMSLGGTQDDPPMGLYDLLMDSAYDAEVQWVTRLASMRGRVAEWLTHGRLMRSPPIISHTPQPSHSTPMSAPSHCEAPSLSGHHGRPTAECSARGLGATAPEYLASAWYLAANATASASLVVLMAAPSSKTVANVSLTLNVTDFGFSAADAGKQFTLTALAWDGGSQLVGKFSAGSVQWETSIQGRYVIALLMQPVTASSVPHRPAQGSVD